MEATSLDNIFSQLLTINTKLVDPDYFLGDLPISDTLSSIQESVRQWQNPVSANDISSKTQLVLLETLDKAGRKGILLNQFPIEIWEHLEKEKPELYSTLRVVTNLKR
jgi:hypothetical protein